MAYKSFALIATSLAAFNAHAGETDSALDKRPAILQQLDGQWLMVGDVRGKPVTYDMLAAPTLQGNFTELHMKDVQRPARYEARVFIGFDSASQTVIAHWLDSFGAKYSVPHGTGQIADNSIQFSIPYPGGTFRDTLIYRGEDNSWSLAIESSQPDGTWKHFGRYEIHRK